VKADTSVKDAAGAIVKVLNRTSSTFVTALRLEASHESLNRALKALAVSRKYMTDQEPGKEVSGGLYHTLFCNQAAPQ
jgi:stage V sporulation protein SpoVS